MRALGAYLEKLGVEPHGEAYIFRNRRGAPYSKDTLGDDFRAVRIAAFGERDKRTLADFRRFGAIEAIAGGASAEQLAVAMANTIGALKCPVCHLCPGQPRDDPRRHRGAPPRPDPPMLKE